MAMIIKRRWGFTFALILAVGSSAQATDETTVVLRATKLLEEISSNPESGIPPRFLLEAKGIMIMPQVVENQLGVGRKKGHGVFLRRNEKGAWGNPEPVVISGVSVGAEAGREVTDIVMIYRNQKAADDHAEQSFSFGLILHIFGSMNHKHKFSGPEANSETKKEVLTYMRKRGILVGATIRAEHKWAFSLKPVELKPPAIADQKSADAKVTVKVTKPDASAPDAKAKIAVDSPEVGRLKTVLTAMTTPPPAQIAETGTKDPKVSPTSGAKPSAATTASPR
jgi:lipid-binding SYLF domain-containing protein